MQKRLKKVLKQKEFSWLEKLQKNFPGAEIFLVGGAVRDLLLNRGTKDFDFVIKGVGADHLEKFLSGLGKINLVGKSFGVFKFRPDEVKKNKKGKYDFEDFDLALPRTEYSGGSGGYKDFEVQSNPRLPIEKDLSRRDFTINAIALKLTAPGSGLTTHIIDPLGGRGDIEKKIIKTVGNPDKRFKEDYTRLLRAVRFSCQLGFNIEKNTAAAIEKNSSGIKKISAERIRDEFNKIIMSDDPERGIHLLHNLGLLQYFIPELEKSVGVSQNKNHIYTVFDHLAKAAGFAAKRGYSLHIRLAALFHDIAKPQTKQGYGYNATFYNHEHLGTKLTKTIMQRLKYSSEDIKKVSHLVRHHMFYYDLEKVTDAGVRRLLARAGKENIHSLIQLRISDRLGMGRPKAKPYKLRVLEQKLQEVQMDPITPSMLKIDGCFIMKKLNLKPGPRIGLLQKALLGEVLKDPKKNTKKYLSKRLLELNELSKAELKKLQPDIAQYEKEKKKEFFKSYKEVE